jgi:hypothetical protein
MHPTSGPDQRRLDLGFGLSRGRRLAFHICAHYLAGVSRRTRPKKPVNLRSWRAIIIRSRGEYLGSIEAPDRERAEAVAIKQFALDDDQRRRLLIRERQYG